MSEAPKIAAFAGSLRKDSFNKKLVQIAAKGASAAGADVTYIDLSDYPLPVYNQDIEEKDGIHENAEKLKKILREQDGFLISSPEYNSSISAALKNFIDWTSRPPSDNLVSFRGKAALLLSASPGGLGGLRGLVHVRSILGNIGVIVLPQQKAVSSAHNVFDDKGNIKDEKQNSEIKKLGADLAEFCKKIKN